MKKYLALALLAAVFSAPSFAAEHEGWVYNGLTGMGYASADTGFGDISDDAFTSNSNIGYRWGVVGVELGYTKFGSFRDNTGGFDFESDLDGFNVGMTVDRNLSDKWSMQGRAGVFAWKADLDLNGANIARNDGTDYYLGVSIDYNWKAKSSIGLGYTYYRADEVDVSLWGLHSEYRFN